MCINYLIVLLAFTASFSSTYLGQSQVFNEFSTVAAGYFMAVLLMLRSKVARKRDGGEPLFELGIRFLICAPPALAAPLAVGATIYYAYYRNICMMFEDCFSLNVFVVYYLANFAINFVFMTGEFYAIILIAFLFCRLICVLERKL
jgi:hypothetical protein